MNMRRHFITTAALAILMVCSLGGWAQQLGKIHGTVKNGEDAMPFEKVELLKDGNPTGKGTMTDADGKFEFSLLDPGSYSIKVTTSVRTLTQEVDLESGETDNQEIQFATALKSVEIIGNREIFSSDPKNMFTIKGKEIGQFSGNRGIESFVSQAPGMVQKDAGDPMNFRGGRSDANATFIDGVKLRGSDQMPLGSIEQISVITGGLPAEYGDVTGAVIVVTTRNPGMSMGSVGKPLTKAEKQMQKQLRKRGSNQGSLFMGNEDLAAL